MELQYIDISNRPTYSIPFWRTKVCKIISFFLFLCFVITLTLILFAMLRNRYPDCSQNQIKFIINKDTQNTVTSTYIIYVNDTQSIYTVSGVLEDNTWKYIFDPSQIVFTKLDTPIGSYLLLYTSYQLNSTFYMNENKTYTIVYDTYVYPTSISTSNFQGFSVYNSSTILATTYRLANTYITCIDTFLEYNLVISIFMSVISYGDFISSIMH